MKHLAAIGLGLLCCACSRQAPSDAPKSVPPASAPASAAAAAQVSAQVLVMPADQANLLALIAAVDANPKDEAAFNRFCTTFEGMKGFDGWTGTVIDAQTSTVDGAIDITLSLGRHLKIEPVVQKSDPVYPAVEALSANDAVTLSGHFSHNKGSSECTYYLSSFAGSLTKVAPR